MRPVSRCTRFASRNTSMFVNAGLSLRKSLPWRMTAMPCGPRSSEMPALATSWMLSSSSTSASSRACFAWG